MSAYRALIDLAYGCYLVCGLAALSLSAIEAGLPSHDVAVGLGFMLIALAIPILIVVGGALLLGIALSLYQWRYWSLPVIGALSVAVMGTAFLTEFGMTKLFYKSVTVIYGAVVLAMSGVWFFVQRRRQFSDV